ncbi:5-dehydro-2-deoxygluconokinase [Proteiniclasticum sp. BAD-10]|uniref:5-dehydro-2-deoxygluconokinase n=1 Tax=Proteiniclasticum sediminis TaxID=2804028 RepID=A0A941HRF1_9CLOT|nr:5-dehydro-2-deoxygluconokinase [Proteiniclasticum sediminis]MBR0577346.1 5-dehydro-2-deoxygluconokinase [Proteiniclasticum sediminis]
MKFDGFDSSRPLDLVLLGRAAIDLNPLDYYKTLAESTTYRKYLGGSPANIAVGLSRLQKKVGFIGKISDDRFGDFVEDTFRQEGVEISHLTRCKNGEKLGLTFTEILSEHESSILMYRHAIADLQLEAEDIDEAYIKSAKALLISGTSLAASPSREAALKAVMLAKKTQTPIIFDIDYRAYNWKNPDEIAVYYSLVAQESTVIIGSREEYDLTQRLLAPGLDDRETARFWCAKKAAIVVIKHGKQGSTAYTCQGDSFSIKPFPVKALKSFGGGDGYASAFLYGLFENWPLRDCLELGSASASMLVKSHGCSADMPSLETIRTFIAESKAEYGEDVCF